MLATISSDQLLRVGILFGIVAAFVFIVDVIHGWSLKRAFLRDNPDFQKR